ncbi:hypothetical protein [Nocardiopsis kunsanensis]|uniref:hypothetical protein n=1 Tax=Nocardiopsis kunsanensis TaxID=141693 RepID=UPI0003492924|nr:hypothetical protein [Nocardiopsis kunsanensis]
MTTAALSPGIRQVLSAPRGRRFTGRREPRTRQADMLAQMQDNPRVRYRQLHGELPAWMLPKEDRVSRPPRPRPEAPPVPRPRTPSGARPAPTTTRTRPRPARPPVPVPQSRPGAHRKPRRRTGWILAGYTLAATAGALASHLLGAAVTP